MRKYQRLLLTIISLTSLVLFLVYRHQYNRLHHVLEVFSFFGTPCNISELQRSESLLLEHDWGPQPIWQELDSKGYIFSAFLVEEHVVEGFGVEPTNNAPAAKSCYLNFEDNIKPVKGKLTVTKIREYSGFIAYIYKCVFIKNNKTPYSITFKNYVSSLIVDTLNSNFNFNTTICVFPGLVTKKSLSEFLSFHSLMGIESFIIYHDQLLPYQVIKLLKNFSGTLKIWISFYSYNLPLSVPEELSKIIIEYDCYYRTKSQTKYSLSLGVNDYLLPHLGNSNSRLRLPIKKFCLNNVNKNKPAVLDNFLTVEDYSFNDIVKVNNFTKSFDAILFDNNSFLIHRYVQCDKTVKTKPDLSMAKYSVDLTRSTLVQMLIHDQF